MVESKKEKEIQVTGTNNASSCTQCAPGPSTAPAMAGGHASTPERFGGGVVGVEVMVWGSMVVPLLSSPPPSSTRPQVLPPYAKTVNIYLQWNR